MASLLLDSIINDTVENFRGRGNDPLAAHNAGFALGGAGLDPAARANSSGQQQAEQAAAEGAGLLEVDIGDAERLVWVLLFSLMVLVAAGGNLIVIYIVSTNRDMKSVTNYFLVNLSLADTMVSTLNVIFNFISMLNR